jgi:DNA processing protein
VIDDDAADWLRVALIPGVGDASLRRLLGRFGTPRAVLDAGATAWRTVVSPAIATALQRGAPVERIDAALAWLDSADHHLLTLADARYPRALLDTADPPTVLFARGRLELLENPALAIVGSRHASAQGTDTAETFARQASDAGLVIVSGLALGIDAAAHAGGLAGRAGSIAVLGTGPDRVYPARNRPLARRLVTEGLLLTEFAPGTGPLPHHFVQRNRVISGLSRAVLVVEAALRSGSLTTARFALEQGRDVFAVPGSILSQLSRGCHLLIKQGAKLVESAADVLEELGLSPAPAARDRAVPLRSGDPVLDALGTDPADLDTLHARTGLDAATLAARLLELELDGRVAALPGGRWQARDRA